MSKKPRPAPILPERPLHTISSNSTPLTTTTSIENKTKVKKILDDLLNDPKISSLEGLLTTIKEKKIEINILELSKELRENRHKEYLRLEEFIDSRDILKNQEAWINKNWKEDLYKLKAIAHSKVKYNSIRENRIKKLEIKYLGEQNSNLAEIPSRSIENKGIIQSDKPTQNAVQERIEEDKESNKTQEIIKLKDFKGDLSKIEGKEELIVELLSKGYRDLDQNSLGVSIEKNGEETFYKLIELKTSKNPLIIPYKKEKDIRKSLLEISNRTRLTFSAVGLKIALQEQINKIPSSRKTLVSLRISLSQAIIKLEKGKSWKEENWLEKFNKESLDKTFNEADVRHQEILEKAESKYKGLDYNQIKSQRQEELVKKQEEKKKNELSSSSEEKYNYPYNETKKLGRLQQAFAYGSSQKALDNDSNYQQRKAKYEARNTQNFNSKTSSDRVKTHIDSTSPFNIPLKSIGGDISSRDIDSKNHSTISQSIPHSLSNDLQAQYSSRRNTNSHVEAQRQDRQERDRQAQSDRQRQERGLIDKPCYRWSPN